MRMLTKTTIAIAVLTMIGTASATTEGGVSRTTDNTKFVQIGDSTGKLKGKPSIKINYSKSEDGSANKDFQAFSKIASMNGKIYVPSSVMTKDSNQVYVARMYAFPKALAALPFIPEHRDLGRMSFQQVGNQDVWFGDWEDVPRNSTKPADQSTKYTVYYAGSNPTTAAQLPKSGQATYTVVGINKHRDPNTAVLKGEMKADFGAKTLNGTISRSDLAVTVNSKIDANAGFNGSATAKVNNAVKASGNSKGHFYGNQAAALAGVADFGAHNQYNTAFGGTKK